MSFKIEPVLVRWFDTNCYLVKDELSKSAVIVDPGGSSKLLCKKIRSENLKLLYLLITHSHIDHIAGTRAIVREFQCDIFVHRDEARTIPGRIFLAHFSRKELKHNQEIDFMARKFKVIHTPGHTKGSVCFFIENYLFSGDLLFCEGVGRWDLPGGSFSELLISLQERLAFLPDDTVVFPGHGPSTTLGRERSSNPLFSQRRRTG